MARGLWRRRGANIPNDLSPTLATQEAYPSVLRGQQHGGAVCLCSKVQGSKKAAPNKYHAKTTLYDGYHYDSILEANYAMGLDWRLKAGDIKAWEKQVAIPIYVNGYHILTTKVDFLVHENDGSKTLVETKGFETPDYKLKKKLIEAVWLHDHKEYSYIVVKQ
jgi:hypothetical protein